MRIFASSDAHRTDDPGAGAELSGAQRAALPPGFESVGEALVSGSRSVVEACRLVGGDLAEAGVSLGEGLHGLRSTTRLVRATDPTFEEGQALAVAWSEGALAFLHRISCTDPITGLVTHAHLQERLVERYAELGHAEVPRVFALVVLQLAAPLDFAGHTRRLTLCGEMARGVFTASETVGRVGTSRLVVLALRDSALAARVGLLRRMVDSRDVRIWIEGLPGTAATAACLLDELARGWDDTGPGVHLG